jgi:polysaccharide biosynthesis/export protein
MNKLLVRWFFLPWTALLVVTPGCNSTDSFWHYDTQTPDAEVSHYEEPAVDAFSSNAMDSASSSNSSTTSKASVFQTAGAVSTLQSDTASVQIAKEPDGSNSSAGTTFLSKEEISTSTSGTLSSIPAMESPETAPSTAATSPEMSTENLNSKVTLLNNNDKPIVIGEILSINVVEEKKPPSSFLVDEHGKIMVPYLGAWKVFDKTCSQVADELKRAYEKSYYKQATVIVSRAQRLGERGRIFVLGQVRIQGSLQIPTDEVFTLSKAVLQAGGFNETANSSQVVVTRRDLNDPTKTHSMTVNVGDILNNGQLDKDIIIQPNDYIFVPARGESSGEILVAGAVRSPGTYPVPAGGPLTITAAIFRAGGFDQFADEEEVKLVRQDPTNSSRETRRIINVKSVLEEGVRKNDVIVKAGDVIIVPEKWFKF